NKAKFIFFSSVGIFGAIPEELPAGQTTPMMGDSIYHQTKIEAEKLIGQLTVNGLKSVIIRPSITYGSGDYGFPFTLVKLIDKNLFFMPDRQVTIHLTNVSIIAQCIIQLLKGEVTPGKKFILADQQPVQLARLAEFIKHELRGKKSGTIMKLPGKLFDAAIWLSDLFNNEAWRIRFQLISRSWYYDINSIYQELNLPQSETIPAFRSVINWYREIK
ncbi:MAG: SDR family oxidoreductase, partial [Calditrichia bacterium]